MSNEECLDVLVAARNAGVAKVIYASSPSVYGDTPELPKREDMKPDPKSPYAVAKLAGEYHCRVFDEIYGLKTVALRYFNVYGPRQDPSSDYVAVIPKFANLCLAGKEPIIYGDGEQTRDFTFVRDVVQANVHAMESDATGVFNVATGARISINDLAGMVMEIIGNRVDCVHEVARAGDVRDSLGDVSRTYAGFGYVPRYGGKMGLRRRSGGLDRDSFRSIYERDAVNM
jgi:UDP-glucose 4-epimerase